MHSYRTGSLHLAVFLAMRASTLLWHNSAQTPPHVTPVAPSCLPGIRIDQGDIIPQAWSTILSEIRLDVRQIEWKWVPSCEVQVQLIWCVDLVLRPVRRWVRLRVIGGDTIGNKIRY